MKILYHKFRVKFAEKIQGAVHMKEITMTILNQTGLHARPAAQIVKLATRFKSRADAFKDDKRADLKDLLELLSLGVCCNDQITIRAEGKDENQLIEKLSDLIREINNS